jgi:histidine kinase
VQLLAVDKQAAYDIALPINEGLYRIGTVHVGLNKGHIDNLVSKLRFTFLGFISLVIVIVFIVSHRIAKYITRPISKLTEMSDELSHGNFDIKLDRGSAPVGWEPSDCPAYVNSDLRCSHFDGSLGSGEGLQGASNNIWTCRQCVFYRKRGGDEVAQLADSFHNMVWSIKLYRRRLHESEEKYRSLFDSGPDAVFVVDSNTLGIIDANPRAVELYGYQKGELLGKSFLELGPEYSRSHGISFAKETDAQGRVFYQKVLHQKKGDKPFFVNLHACHISLKGKPTIIVAATDITEIVEKDTQLIQASKMKSLGEMSAGIAHELNQPLNAIKMGSDFLTMMVERDLEIPKNQLEQVATEMSTQVDRAADIINTLRAFGRKADLITEQVDINKAVRGVLSIVGRQLELENISFRLELAEEISPILAHDNRLQQVFFNLVVNARDAIKTKNQLTSHNTGGIITVRTFESGGQVVAEVHDTGTGIQEAVREKIFEPFFTTKETSQYMGLGLAITYGIVKDYGGDILVLGREGEGATFVVSFSAVA